MVPKQLHQIIWVFAFALTACLNSPSHTYTGAPTAIQGSYPDFNVQIPDKALLKNYLTVSLQTEPGAICDLTFIPPSGEIREMTATANLEGVCTWRWKLEESFGRGHGRLIFTINGISDTHFIDIRPEF